MKKLIILFVLIGAVIGFFAFGLNEILTLEYIKSRQADLIKLRDSAPVMVSLVFFALYVVITALSLPGAGTTEANSAITLPPIAEPLWM